MNIDQQIKNRSELDARRVATGAHCRIISDFNDGNEPSLRGLLDLLVKSDLVPDHVKIDPETGYDPSSGVMMVIALSDVEFVSKQMAEAKSSILDQDILIGYEFNSRREYETNEYETRKRQIESELMRNIRDHIAVVTVDNRGSSRPPNAKFHSVYVSTLEQSPARAEVVTKIKVYRPVEERRR